MTRSDSLLTLSIVLLVFLLIQGCGKAIDGTVQQHYTGPHVYSCVTDSQCQHEEDEQK